MDFRQITQPNSGRPATSEPEAPASHKEERSSGSRKRDRSPLQIFNLVMLVGIAILIAGVAVALTRGNSGTTKEARYVDPAKYQAVFLDNGQVYFGNITNLNNNYLRMSNVYYLTQGDTASSNYTLVKLGCQQIHDPMDEMLINRAQVSFWENLEDKGKVVSSIKDFQDKNPNGPDCSQVSSQTQASGTNAQGNSTKP